MWSLVSQARQHFQNNPWDAVNILDDVVGSRNAWMAAPLIGYEASVQPRGDQFTELVSSSTGLVVMSSPLTSKTVSGLMSLVLPGLGGPVGWITRGLTQIVIGGMVNNGVRAGLRGSLRWLREYDVRTRRLEMGGRYQDSGTAQAWRMSAIQEMSGALGNARSYLGNEAMFHHR